MSPKAAAEALIEKHGARVPVPVEAIAEAEGVRIDYQDLEDRISGLLIRRDGEAIIAVNLHHHPNRQRFTISHELGHFILHQKSPTVFVDDYMVHFRADASSRQSDRREMQANVFAANLLMPERSLQEDLEENPIDVSDEAALRALAERYKVSPQALTIRLVNLGLAQGLPL